MDRLKADASLIDGAETALSESSKWSDVQVDTVGGNQQRTAPKVLLDTTDHPRVSIGHSSDDGKVRDDQGNIIGERQRVMYKTEPDLLAIHSHETESYRLQNVLYKWFNLIEDYPEELGPMVSTVRVGDPYPKEIDYEAADAVFVQALPIYLLYEDTLVDERPEPIEEFYNEYENNSEY
jgi:hypothetical protein